MAVAEPYIAPSSRTVHGLAALHGISRRMSRASVLDRAAIGALLLVTALAAFVPLIAPHGTDTIVGDAFGHPTWHFLMGTDDVGRDIFSRVLYGLRTSWFSALAVIASGVLVGGSIGLVAGSFLSEK